MAPPPAWATSGAQKKQKPGLSLGSTIGIGLGIALFVILSAFGAWLFIRRRRSQGHAYTASKQSDSDLKEEQDVDNMTQAMGPAEMDGGLARRKEDEKKYMHMDRDVAVEMDGEKGISELGGGGRDGKVVGGLYDKRAYEMPATGEAVEIEGKAFVAELDGSSAGLKKAG